ncbi:hypothetical protein CPB85DRAFT_734941 [Mucidula mucida]|nr:hypothetical protein CPB85DRAFT_734941 [Mucidula mucida]
MSSISSATLYEHGTPYSSPRHSAAWLVPRNSRRSLSRIPQSNNVDIVSPETFLGEVRYSAILTPDATTAQRVSLLDCSVDVELRHPPVNPRKARRHCLNFGFGGETEDEDARSPTILSSNSSPTSGSFSDDRSSSNPSAVETCVDTESESDYSSLKDIEMEFPKPPSISPMLRRMRSSPTFAENAHLFRHTTRRPHITRSPNSYSRHMSDVSVYSSHLHFRETGGRTNGLAKDFDKEGSVHSTSHGRRNSVSGWEKTHRTSRTEPNVSPRTRRQSSQSSDALRGRSLHQCHDAMVTPRLVRRASSSAPQLDRPPTAPRTIHKMRSLKFHPSQPPSRPETNKPKPMRSLLRGRSVSMEFVKGGSNSGLSLFNSKQKSHHRSHLSLGTTLYSNEQAGSRSSIPSRHRSKAELRFRHEKDGLQSFMDISPEDQKSSKRDRSANKEKVRRLWVRASNGIVEWGRGLSRKQV